MARKKKKNIPKKRGKEEEPEELEPREPLLSPETKNSIAVIFVLVLALISLLSIFGLAGALGKFVLNALRQFMGWGGFVSPIILLMIAVALWRKTTRSFSLNQTAGIILLVLSLAGLLHLFVATDTTTAPALAGRGGGFVGFAVSIPLLQIMGFWATLIVLFALLLVSGLLLFDASLSHIRQWFVATTAGTGDEAEKTEVEAATNFTVKKIPEKVKETTNNNQQSAAGKELTPEEEAAIAAAHEEGKLFPEPKKKLPRIDLPLELLTEPTGKPNSGDIELNKEKIQKTLGTFGIQVDMHEVNVGPTITQYTLKPADGVKLSNIVGLQNDLAMALATHPLRIEAPIPGKALVGIEVPNRSVAAVYLKEIFRGDDFRRRKSNLAIALGKDVSGNCRIANLETMPHLLIAGATGSGKSVCINAIILSLLYQNHAEDLRMIMVDPKRVEFTPYNDIPHLLTPVITDVKRTVNALRWTVNEMDRRYEVLSGSGQRNINAYNVAHAEEKLPYIVLIIDELADLMAVAAREVEAYIIRLAQMARAVGIHIIVATQRPSVNVLTGLIKANITSRIAFAVASQIDSRTVLDSAGAEKLLGRGDMLYVSAELGKPARMQGVLVSDEEIRRVVDYLKDRGGEPEYDETVVEKQGNTSLVQSGVLDGEEVLQDEDPLLDEAKDAILKAGRASASLLQRRLRVGYARAARLLDLLEEEGFIGPGDGAKPREILVERPTDQPTDFIPDVEADVPVVEKKADTMMETEGDEEEADEKNSEKGLERRD